MSDLETPDRLGYKAPIWVNGVSLLFLKFSWIIFGGIFQVSRVKNSSWSPSKSMGISYRSSGDLNRVSRLLFVKFHRNKKGRSPCGEAPLPMVCTMGCRLLPLSSNTPSRKIKSPGSAYASSVERASITRMDSPLLGSMRVHRNSLVLR